MEYRKMASLFFNVAMFILGVGFCLLFLNWGSGSSGETVSSRDTLVMLAEKPVINNYSITNPTKLKETVIIYDSTKPFLTRADSDFIVLDYLKRREYSDSVGNDTSFVKYNAVVEKNTLAKIDITPGYRPKTILVKEKIYKNSYFAGLAPGMQNGRFTTGVMLSRETKRAQFGIVYDPIAKGGYIILCKRINL